VDEGSESSGRYRCQFLSKQAGFYCAEDIVEQWMRTM
jgi:hypothetical protein